MNTQNQIKRKLGEAEAIEYVRRVLDTEKELGRVELADLVCEEYGFYDPLGSKQRAGCLKALRELERDGRFTLPASKRAAFERKPVRLGSEVAEPENLPDEVGKIGNLELVVVRTPEQRRICNELLIRDHPRGAALLVGRQIHYMVRSEHGWLGAFAFGSSALQLEDRDEWIGWDREERREKLHFAVNMNRFLIRSCVSCRNLASRLLSMVASALPSDFEELYGYRPLLIETFVDASMFEGTCYRASNWIRVGRTKGIGRQGDRKQRTETPKDIYVLPLEKNFRDAMGIRRKGCLEAVDPTRCAEDDGWAESEFGDAPLGDRRLSARLVEIAEDRYRMPGASYGLAVDGDKNKVKGYYRFVDQSGDSAVSMENILRPHRLETMRRMAGQAVVLCIQDGTDLNYSSLDRCEGLGVIATNQTGAISKGLHLHSMIAATGEGLPLGLLWAKCFAPESRPAGDKRPYCKIPIEEKTTFNWILGLRECEEVKSRLPDTRVVCVMDREADFVEMFDEQRTNCGNVDLLVRARHNRATTGKRRLFETVKASPVRAELKIVVPRQSARAKKSKQQARPKRDERTAEVSLRYKRVEVKTPRYYGSRTPMELWAVNLSEHGAPADAKPVEWMLLSTAPIKSVEEAVDCVKWYCRRWRIEDWHRVLKSGCGVEKLAHKTAERLKTALSIAFVIAWRIMFMTLLGREAPELPPDVFFSKLELEVLRAYAEKKT